MDDVDRQIRDLRREVDRLTNGGLIMAKDLDMRGFRILNIGNPEDFGDVPSQTQTEETVADAGTGTGTSGDVSGPGVSVAGAIAYFDDTSGTSLASGSATITSAGAISATSLALTTALPVTSGGTGRLTSTTAYALLAAGTTATGAHQTLAAGATTEILVGGGASALPVWTTATGSGAPVRANTPTLVMPNIGVATGTSLNLSGSFGVAATQSIWLGGLGAGSRIRQDISANMQFSVSATDVWRILADGNWVPNAATWGVGSASVGVSGVYFDDGGGDTARVVAPSLSGDITVTLPAAAGTLTRTDGDAIGQTTAAAGKFTTLQRRAGTSTGYGGAVVTLDSQFTPVGNVGVGTDDLMTYTLPANALAANGDWVRVTAFFVTANNANSKNLTLRFGGTSGWALATAPHTNGNFSVIVDIVRTGASTQRISAMVTSNSADFQYPSGTAMATTATATETDTSTIVIKFQCVGTADNDIVQNRMLIEYGSLS